MDMDMDAIKGEIISHLAEMSDLRVGEATETPLYDKDETVETSWVIYEDKNKASASDWIEKEAAEQCIGRVVLNGTKLHYEAGFKPTHKDDYYSRGVRSERMFLSDLVAPDSFDKAINVLSHALKVLNVCKMPKGVGIFGSMTPPGMSGMPPNFRK